MRPPRFGRRARERNRRDEFVRDIPMSEMARCSATGKRSYLDRRAARVAKRRLIGDGTAKNVDRLSVYRCQTGDHYHLGHRPRMYWPPLEVAS